MTTLIIVASAVFVALAVHRLTCRRTIFQDAVRALYWLSHWIQSHACAWDSYLIAYREYQAEGPIRPRNEMVVPWRAHADDCACSDRAWPSAEESDRLVEHKRRLTTT